MDPMCNCKNNNAMRRKTHNQLFAVQDKNETQKYQQYFLSVHHTEYILAMFT